MALTVTQAFDEFQENTINLDSEKAAKAVSSREWLIGQINNFPENYSDFPAIYSEKNIAYGSFSRKTKKRPLDDVDLIICLKANVNELARNVADGHFHSVADMVKETGQSISGFIEAMLEPVQSIEPNVNPVELAERKRRMRQMQQNQGIRR